MDEAMPFFESVLRKPLFLGAILDFNKRVQAEMGPGEIPESLVPWLSTLPDHARQDLLPRSTFFWDFREESTRVVFLSDSQLFSAAACLGVTIHAKAIAECILRSEREALRAGLGETLYTYALARGQYMVGRAAKIAADWDRDSDVLTRVNRHGWRAFWFLAQNWQPFLRDHFCLRLTRAWEKLEGEASLVSSPLPQATWALLWHFVKKCLLREVTPTWGPFFTL